MAATRLIEQESGTYTGPIRHAHNGYYAGDFPALHVPAQRPPASQSGGYLANPGHLTGVNNPVRSEAQRMARTR